MGSLATYIGLLRGINVSGRNKIAMPDLCRLCAKIGYDNVQTYIQSGNLVFSTYAKAAAIEIELERAIAHRFHLQISVIVRAAADWPANVTGNPFPKESSVEPKAVMLALAEKSPRPEAAAALQARATGGERIMQVGDALWIHFAGGMTGTKITTALLDRVVGSPVTLRNWRTVLKLQELAIS